ncbi:MAG: ATP phosphoribosyltransferase regulatory subunit [Minwuia sp.]|uniref:ATP phosphoribosyltransferase regulatory subunit n=1 Tax=Minwuia sp. TaxID=2493630 RepID=UPI003A8935B0
MNDQMHKALLPTGLTDALPEQAEVELDAVRCLQDTFRGRGYRAVKPPLLEFEENLLTGPGAGLTAQIFRLMDPISQRMMGLRADMTPQIARLAATRLAAAPRPLRLCYSGQVLRVRGDQLRPERQFTQAGIELLGSDTVAAEAEVLLLVVEGLRKAGVDHITVDLTLPALAPMVLKGQGYDPEAIAAAREALDGKDAGELKAVVGDDATVFALLDAVGVAADGMARLKALGVSGQAGQLIDRLAELVDMVAAADPALSLTVDPGEYRGFEYQSGVAFAIFARGVRGEIARGGRYTTDAGETAVGATVYLDAVVRALTPSEQAPLAYAPYGTSEAHIAAARENGFAVVSGLDPETDPADEAQALGCSHILRNGAVSALV